MTPEALPDPIEVAVAFTRVLDELGVAYVIGGSMASSVHGEPRTTNDVDLVADLRSEHVNRLATALGRDYYMSTDAARAAVRARGSFNVIHVKKAVKVDIFIAGNDPLNLARLRDKTRVQVSADAHLWIDTPEHSVLRKLEWFRRGGEVSERQWRDVVAMLRVQGERLDRTRLRDWSARLRVGDLLERAFAEAEAGA